MNPGEQFYRDGDLWHVRAEIREDGKLSIIKDGDPEENAELVDATYEVPKAYTPQPFTFAAPTATEPTV